MGGVRFCVLDVLYITHVHKQGNTAKSFANTGTHQDAEYILQHVTYVQRYLRIGMPVCSLEHGIVVRSQVISIIEHKFKRQA